MKLAVEGSINIMTLNYKWDGDKREPDQAEQALQEELVEIRKFAVERAVELTKVPHLMATPVMVFAEVIEAWILRDLEDYLLAKYKNAPLANKDEVKE